MALATQCPHCHTTFRVAHDQLKLRAGLVRCGVCKQIFNGIENLLRPEEAEKAFPPAQQQPLSLAPASPLTDEQPLIQENQDKAPVAAPEPTPTAEADEASEQEDQQPVSDPLLRMTLVDIAPARATPETSASDTVPEQDDTDELDKTIGDLQEKPWRDEEGETSTDALDRVDEREYEEPGFVKQARRRQRIGRIMHVMMVISLPLLLLALLAQAAYSFRVQLAARFPETRPVLLRLCDALHCEVGLPTAIESVSLESSELQTASSEPGPLSLVLLLRNQSATVQAWPNIELTLNDADEKPLARRVFVPHDYLPAAQDVTKGFAPKSEQPVKLYLELSGLKASGYRVYLFYP